MATTTNRSVLENTLEELNNVTKTGTETWEACCPAHNDSDPSLSVTVGESQPVVMWCHAGCDFKEIAGELDSLDASWKPWEGTEVDRYTYRDAGGGPLYDVVRFEMRNQEHPAKGDKTFVQQAHVPEQEDASGTDNGCPDGYVWGRKKYGIDPVLYRLPAVKDAANEGGVVFIVEGEKDVHTLEDLGFVATTGPQGAGKWADSHTAALSGARVIIVPDNDDEGRKHARNISRSVSPVAKGVRILDLPDLPKKGDVTDWVESRRSAGKADPEIRDQLKGLAQDTETDEAPDIDSKEIFWRLDEDGEVQISQRGIVQFLEAQGYRKYYRSDEDGESQWIRVDGQIVHRVPGKERLRDAVLDYVRDLVRYEGLPVVGDEGGVTWMDNRSASGVLAALHRGSNVYLSRAIFKNLRVADLDWKTDTATEAFYYYKNCAMRVTTDGIKPMSYEEIDGYIWASQIIDREFEHLRGADRSNWDWAVHLANVAGRSEARLEALQTSIGYLLHGYKDPSEAKCIVYMDEDASDVEAGRTGKSLTLKSLQHLVPTARLDGRTWDPFGKFAWQSVGSDTRVVDINDAANGFEFRSLFSVVTDSMPIEKKNQDKSSVPFEDAPKFALSTNYVLEGRGPSFEDRTHIVEFSSHYSDEHEPLDEFDDRFFDEWSGAQWTRFDNVMLACVHRYLEEKESGETNQGLVSDESKDLPLKRLRAETCDEWAEFMFDWLPANAENEILYDALINSFEEAYPNMEGVQRATIGKWVSAVDDLTPYVVEKGRSRSFSAGSNRDWTIIFHDEVKKV